ncbi:tRNA (guanosine(46)-N7)-methyltransferase TrmB [Thalassobacillus sp. C254]|uniref:tRNA (guanosine(46)-N7)-methyltransferase TrmB n=1 Tax=Thalassobacillus sp. C254 TaxID=1225341 RepID=UPI0006D189BB|nr:tRNA (guanosine(46)-N7)-methyltransferase TrmB [Thalassobacillus sp. C254]
MRLRNKPWAMEYLQSHPEYVITNPEDIQSWKQHFGTDHPLHVEVGTGKGKFLKDMSEKYPNINFIGVEKYESVLVSGVEKAVESKPTNLAFIHADVNNLFDYFKENEIDQLYINFTDPWPKARHEKRRLTYKGFLSKYKKVLKNNGEIHFKTDNQGLFEYSIESMSSFGMILKNVSLDLHKSSWDDNVMTEYEEKFSKKNYRIYRLEAQFEKPSST